MRKSILASIVVVFLFTLPGCSSSGGEYGSLVRKEMKSGKRVDSIFFDINFGMSSKQFFGYCWEMNKKGLFTDGVNNSYVLYKLNNGELAYPASMNFYPDFYKDKLFRMRVEYQYNEWAPWNKKLYSEFLIKDILRMYKKTYAIGNSFITVNDDKRGEIYVKIDGNRRIIIGRFDDRIVKVDFTDLTVEQQLK